MLEKWRAASDEVNTSTPPTIPASGTDGYPQDKDVGVKGTPIKSWWYHMMQQSLAAVVSGCGGTFGANTTALWAALAPRLSAILSASSDTGSLTTDHDRAVIASSASQVTEAGAVVMGCNASKASGILSAAIASQLSEAAGSLVAAIGTYGCKVAAIRAVLLAARGVELAVNNAIGGGYNLSAVTPAGVNQFLSWLIRSEGGHAHFEGTVKVGGDVNAGTGEKIALDGAAGSLRANSLVIPDTGEGHRVGWTSFTGLNIVAGAWSDALNVSVAGMSGVGSRVLATVLNCTGGAPVISEIVVRDESFGVRVQNVGSTTCTQVAFTWFVIDTP